MSELDNHSQNSYKFNDSFSYKENKSYLKISFERIAFIFFIFFILAIIFSSKVILLSIKKIPEIQKIIKKDNFRSSILDNEGNILAKSVPVVNIGINPNLVINKEKLLISLKLIFPNKSFDKEMYGKKFFYVKKKISPEKLEQVLLLGDKSFIQEDSIARVYPNGNLFSHVIGQIDNDNNGISGIEKTFDYELTTTKEPLKLTLDKDLQYLIKEELSKSKDIFQNIGSAAILMDINDGNILSMVSLPDFDLNKREKINDVKYINRATKGVYEFGSVFKTFTLAAGLQYSVVEPETEFKDLKKKITCAGNSISEYDDKIPSDLTAEEILIRSGNIGSVRIAEKVGIENYNEFLQTIGIISNLEFDIQEVGTTQLGRWGKCKLATVAFGHGIATTLLQLSKGYSIISNGGYQITPTLLKKEKLQRQRILNENLSETINPILRKIVSTKEGTAGFADVKGYEIGGKTGTADQPSMGGYSKKKVNTFASVFPTSDPKFVLAVMLDEPKANREFIYHYRDDRYPYKGNWRNTAGWTTVWVAGQIIEKIGPILATKY
ncbi:penicillin-binding protein 2 [Pelagibacterales bacterium SAG-MED34]|nr:penicillin-binding protein 2 [Pelagibacterales bacterium SAG-MED34]